jgi:hypothetical protein
MQTPGAENAMLTKRVAGYTDSRRSVASECHLFGIIDCMDATSEVAGCMQLTLRLCMWRSNEDVPGSSTAVTQVKPGHV